MLLFSLVGIELHQNSRNSRVATPTKEFVAARNIGLIEIFYSPESIAIKVLYQYKTTYLEYRHTYTYTQIYLLFHK